MLKYHSVNRPIIELKKTYEDSIHGFYLYSSIDNINNTIRHGRCVADFGEFREGDELFTRHDTIRKIYAQDTKREKESVNYNDIYALDEVCAYIRDGEFHAVSPYLWVRPIVNDSHRTVHYSGDENPDMYQDREEPQHGIVVYSNDELRGEGITEGDHIIFNRNSEYRYDLGDEKLYRMQTPWIIAKIEDD